MPITFKVGSASPLNLAEDGRQDTTDFSPSFQDALRILPGLRTAEADLENDGNRLVSFPFTVTRSHASEADAKVFLLSQIAAIPAATGVLTISHSAAGSGSASITLNKAAVRIAASRHVGLTTITTFEAQGRFTAP